MKLISRNTPNDADFFCSLLNEGTEIASIYRGKNAQKDTELIIKAVNSFEEMKEALKKATELLNYFGNTSYMESLDRKQIEQALKNAEYYK